MATGIGAAAVLDAGVEEEEVVDEVDEVDEEDVLVVVGEAWISY